MSFTFGGPPKTASGFTLPTAAPASTAAAATPSTGFSFCSGDNKQSTQPASGLFGQPAANLTSQPSTGGLTFGLGQTKTPVASSAAPATFGFGSSAPQSAASTGRLTLGAPASSTQSTTSAPPSFGLSFGAAPASAPSTTSSIGTSLSFTPILGSTVTSSAAPSTGLSLGFPAASSAGATQPKLQLGTPSTAVASSAPSLSMPAASTAALAPTQTTSISATIPTTSSLTFAQLEDSINKWTIDLEEQGKFFVNQAKQLNAWDSLLISNGEKILNLNSSIERVKQQQSQLDHELDFVLAQQKELEELLVPLEKELVEIPVTDIDRNQMYQFAEIIDSQLKQISDDLKEIIENINESNKDEEISNPITQIGKILNAHMNSLQWIDRNTAQISSQLELISKSDGANKRNLNLNNSLNNSMNMF